MSKIQEKLLVATLSGLILVGVAGFALTPGLINGESASKAKPASTQVIDLRPSPGT